MPKRIAVIDDDLGVRRVLQAALEDEGYGTILLPTALEAAVSLSTTVPDLVFLDIHMEQRDVGWSLLSLLWLEPTLGEVPVIVSSGDAQDLAARRKDVEAPHCIFLEKPFQLDDLLAAVERLIGPALTPERR